MYSKSRGEKIKWQMFESYAFRREINSGMVWARVLPGNSSSMIQDILTAVADLPGSV
jgi:hypothetical protein